MDMMRRYQALREKVVDRKREFDALMGFVEESTAYLDAPASTRFHLCRPGGLLEHSVNVAETMLALRDRLAPWLSAESCVIVALLHDLGKAGMPGQPQYLENAPSPRQAWAGHPASVPYRFNQDLLYLGVPLRSLLLALPRLPLSPEEVQAIMYHDGQYVAENRGVAARECPLTLLLQYADNWSGFVLESARDTIGFEHKGLESRIHKEDMA